MAAIVAATGVFADTWWVQKDGGVDAEGYGKSESTPFRTIQYAVDAAQLDDVVLVAPGWYDEGGATAGSSDAYLTNRVYINKRITIRSRDGRASRDSTFIVGRHATVPEDPEGMGMGPDAIRCVRFASDSNTYGATLEGFTLVNGATHYNGGDYARCSSGGGADFGANVTDESKAQYLVDCVISNCVAARGGGMYYGNAVRCLFVNNYANRNGAVVRNGNIYWCVLDGNWGSTGIAYLDNKKAVNCTGVNSISHSMFKGNNVGSEGFLYNCVALQHGTTSVSFTYPSNCVLAANVAYYSGNNSTSGTSTNTCRLVGMDSLQFASTATGDLRPLTTGDLIGAGDAALLANIPEKYRYTDYDGKTVDPSKPLHAGAIQTTVEPKGGALRFTSYSVNSQNTPGLTVDGHMLCADKLYSVALEETRVCRVECLMPLNPAKRFFGYAAGKADEQFTIYRFPKRGTAVAHIMAPRTGEVTVIPCVTENVLWTDPSVQDGAEMDGTEEHPYNTLQAAVDRATGTKGYWMVYAKKGRYDKGGALYGGLTNRVAFTNDKTYINLYAVDGPEETFIVGAADGSSEHPYGYGDAAIRCVGSITGCATVNGFTLTGGRCKLNNGSEVDGTAGGYGGGAYSTTSTFQIEDCVITNCAASRGAVAWMAALRRCLVTDCTTTYIGALRGGVHASACVFKDIKKYRSNSDYIVGQADLAYNCTFICNDTGDANICVNDNYSANGMYGSVVYGFSKIPYTPSSQICAYYYDNVGTVEPSAKTDARLTPCKIAFADAEDE